MPQPNVNDVHVDAALTDFSVAYLQEPGNFIASQVFPFKPVPHMTNKYFIFAKNDALRNDAFMKRAPGAKAPRSGFTVSTDSYSADPQWGEVPLDEMTMKNADPSINLEQYATRLVTQRGLIAFDALFVTRAFATGIWGTDYVAGTDFTAWDDYASDPQRDIDNLQSTVLKNTGKLLNTLTVGFNVFKALRRHPVIKDMYKFTSSESVSVDMIARALDIEKMVVAKASYASNAEGGTAAYAFIAGQHALLTYNDGSPSVMTPCAGATFAWTDLDPVTGAGVAIDQYYEQSTRSTMVRGQFAFDVKVTGSDLGAFLSAAAT